jgi:beta-glucosidase
MPLRAVAKMSGGLVDKKMADGIVDVVNGHFLRGAGALAGGFIRNAVANRKMEKQLNR